jgi:hypothetical protein
MIIPIDARTRLRASTIFDRQVNADLTTSVPGGAPPQALTAKQRSDLAHATWVDLGPLMQRIRFEHEQFNAVGFLVNRPPLSEQEIVQRALHLADPKATILQKAQAMLNFADGRLVSHDSDMPAAVAGGTAEHGHLAVEHWWQSVAKEREMFRAAVLDVAATNAPGDRPRYRRPQRKPMMKKYTPWISESLEDIVIVPRLVWEHTRSKTELRYYSLNTRAACGFALMLLLDDRRPLKERLRLCRETGGCGRPFLASVNPGGSAPSVYCSEDCRANAKREQTAARVARLRARRAKGEAA